MVVVPAILPSSREDLEKKLALFWNIPSVSRIQIDIVDGQFASPASWPYTKPTELREMLARRTMLPHTDRIEYEIDFMCTHPEEAARAWLTLGATRLTFHAESVADMPRALAAVRRQYGLVVSVGLALGIASDLALIEPCIEAIDYVQLMGIARIGRQGQPFDRRVSEKIRVFRARHRELPVQVDGGISLKNAKALLALGVSNLIVGSALLGAGNPAAAFAAFEALETPYGV